MRSFITALLIPLALVACSSRGTAPSSSFIVPPSQFKVHPDLLPAAAPAPEQR